MDFTFDATFLELTNEEKQSIDGGGFWSAVAVFAGVVLIAVAPAVGIGVSIAGATAAGSVAAGASLAAVGATSVEVGCAIN